jgi:hypothetical protein
MAETVYGGQVTVNKKSLVSPSDFALTVVTHQLGLTL